MREERVRNSETEKERNRETMGMESQKKGNLSYYFTIYVYYHVQY